MEKMSLPAVVCILSLFLISGALAVGKYSRIASYEDEIVVRCPDRTKKAVQILQEHSDVWRRGQESIDLRLKRDMYEAVQSYFPECWVMIEDLEAHVQEAENQMFPARKAEEDVWVQQIVEELITPGKDLATCEKELERLEVKFQTSSTWFKEYHDYDAICLWYSQLSCNNPDLVQYVPSIGKSVEGRDMPAVHITASSDIDRKKIYFQCQIHAREWISGATCMYISEYLVENYGSDAQVTSFLDSVEFVIVPFVNPDGYAYTWSGDRLWRKNRETQTHSSSSCIGVDLNRNFPQAWRSSEFQCAEDYAGPSAGSEPETQNIMNYYRQNAPIIGAVDWHSHGQLILRPWGWSDSLTSNDDILGTLGQEMADKIYQVHSQHYTSQTSYDLYQCFGIASDWFYSDNASSTNSGYRAVAYVIELRDQSTYGFLLPPEQIIPTGEEIVAAVLHFTERVMEHPIVYQRGGEAAAAQQQENEPIGNYQSHS